MAILYWVKWKSSIYTASLKSPIQGFEEMQDMFRYSGDMPCKVHYTPPPQDLPFGVYHVELKSDNLYQILIKRIFPRWNSFGAWTKFIDYINDPST